MGPASDVVCCSVGVLQMWWVLFVLVCVVCWRVLAVLFVSGHVPVAVWLGVSKCGECSVVCVGC